MPDKCPCCLSLVFTDYLLILIS